MAQGELEREIFTNNIEELLWKESYGRQNDFEDETNTKSDKLKEQEN